MTADFSISKGHISDEELAALVAVVNSVASNHAKTSGNVARWSNPAQGMRNTADVTAPTWRHSTLPR